MTTNDESNRTGTVTLTGTGLTIWDVHRAAVHGDRVDLDPARLAAVARTHERVQEWGEAGHPIYGVNTGFGEMIHMIVPAPFKTQLQENLIRSHAAGGGEPLDDQVVRAILAVRANCLVKGHSGISPAVLGLLREFLNRRIHPVIPEQGSLGASGDLAPLSHMALSVIGGGLVRAGGRTRPTAEVLEEHGLTPATLGYKEGLALVNGTSAMTGAACLALVDAYRLVRVAVLASADIVQCMRASDRPFDPRGHLLKNHSGQIVIAREMRRLLAGSRLTREHGEIMRAIHAKSTGSSEVFDSTIYLQNAYSLRCMPQVLGAVLDTLDFCRRIVEEEVNSCNDNPLIFDTPDDTFHGANFHGQYVAMACDHLNVALAEIGVLAERQINRLLDPHLNKPLPPFLGHGAPGLACGFEGGQYLATSIAAENLDLAAPASIKSLPSNGQNQDVVSMGLISARRSLQLARNVSTVLAILVASCHQAYYFLDGAAFSAPLHELHDRLARSVPRYDDDVPFVDHLASIRDALASPEIEEWVDAQVSLVP